MPGDAGGPGARGSHCSVSGGERAAVGWVWASPRRARALVSRCLLVRVCGACLDGGEGQGCREAGCRAWAPGAQHPTQVLPL